jgi:iron complex transport system substrate-binding protein
MRAWRAGKMQAAIAIFAGRGAACCALFALLAATSAAASVARAHAMDEPQAKHVVTDDTGRKITVVTDVRRIVSLAPSLTETIYALGAESRLAADTDYCDVPAAAKTKPHVGSPVTPSLEAIVGMKPDLVLAASINRYETVEALEKVGIPVYESDPRTVEELIAGIERLANVIGIAEQGRDLAAKLRSRVNAVEKNIAGEPRCRALFVVWEDPLTSIGPKTFIADAMRIAGADTVVNSSQDWPHVSLEAVVHMQPDVLIFARDHGDENPQMADLRARPGWREMDAVKRGHIAVISGEVDRPAPGLIDAVESLARQLHPDAFEKSVAGSAHACSR